MLKEGDWLGREYGGQEMGEGKECKRRRENSMRGKEIPGTIALMSLFALGESALVENKQARGRAAA
jgi:hypothetical protein